MDPAREGRAQSVAEAAPGDAIGAVYDFHALRCQFATDLERAGVGLATAQRLMRHSTPQLTAKTYTKRSATELASAVGKLRTNRGKR